MQTWEATHGDTRNRRRAKVKERWAWRECTGLHDDDEGNAAPLDVADAWDETRHLASVEQNFAKFLQPAQIPGTDEGGYELLTQYQTGRPKVMPEEGERWNDDVKAAFGAVNGTDDPDFQELRSWVYEGLVNEYAQGDIPFSRILDTLGWKAHQDTLGLQISNEVQASLDEMETYRTTTSGGRQEVPAFFSRPRTEYDRRKRDNTQRLADEREAEAEAASGDNEDGTHMETPHQRQRRLGEDLQGGSWFDSMAGCLCTVLGTVLHSDPPQVYYVVEGERTHKAALVSIVRPRVEEFIDDQEDDGDEADMYNPFLEAWHADPDDFQ